MRAEIDATTLTKGMTLELDVRGVTALRVRIWLGLALIRLATRIIGCGLEIKS